MRQIDILFNTCITFNIQYLAGYATDLNYFILFRSSGCIHPTDKHLCHSICSNQVNIIVLTVVFEIFNSKSSLHMVALGEVFDNNTKINPTT